MKEEFDQEDVSEEKSKSKAPKIIGILVAILLLGIGGYLGWAKFLNDPEDGASAAGRASTLKSNAHSIGTMFALEPFVVNLNDPGGKRYLKTKIELEFINGEVLNELEGRLPQLRDSILILLSSKMLEDIQSIDGKIALRNALIMRINQLLTLGKIKNLYFTEFVVQ